MSIIWNRAAVADGLEVMGLCRKSLHSYFKELLDSYHGETRSLAYYDVLAGDWLEIFAHLTYVAWREVLAGMEPIARQQIPVSSDLVAYGRMTWQQSGLHEHLRWAVARLLEGSSPGEWNFECRTVRISSGGDERMPVRLLRGMATAKPDVLVTSPYFKCSRTEWAGAILRWHRWLAWDDLKYPINVPASVDVAWRMTQAVAAGPVTNLNDLLRVLMPLHLPVILLEGFANYRTAVLDLPVARPKVVYSANALHGHMTFKLLVAEWRQHGTRLLYHQHGGAYGLDRIHVMEDYEIRASDNYFTWGWRRDEAHVKPLSAPLPYSSRRSGGRLLLSCGDYPQLVYRLQFCPMPGTIETMRRETCKFLTTLRRRTDLLIRPYPNDYGGGFVARMRKAAPHATFDDHRISPFVRYAESRLVVHNYFCTGLLETLALNIPTVCFFDPDAYAFREAAQLWIDVLEHVGVLHRSGVAAARFVAGLGSNPNAWWKVADVQDARQGFVDHYANFSSGWRQQWEREFGAVLAGMH